MTEAHPLEIGTLVKDTAGSVFTAQNIVVLLLGSIATIIGCLFIITGPSMVLGYTTTCLKIVRGQGATTDDLWSGFQRFGSVLFIGLAMALLVGIGFALLVVPGLILGALFSFVFFLLADNPSLSGVDALKQSVTMVKSHLGEVVLLWVISLVAVTLFNLVPVVGGIVGFAFAMMLTARAYVALTSSSAGVASAL